MDTLGVCGKQHRSESTWVQPSESRCFSRDLGRRVVAGDAWSWRDAPQDQTTSAPFVVDDRDTVYDRCDTAIDLLTVHDRRCDRGLDPRSRPLIEAHR